MYLSATAKCRFDPDLMGICMPTPAWGVKLTLFVPSGGGHWAVQGPVMVKAALRLNASLPKTAMAVAFGEQTANLVQPFWALPIVSIGWLASRQFDRHPQYAEGNGRNKQLVPPPSFAVQQQCLVRDQRFF